MIRIMFLALTPHEIHLIIHQTLVVQLDENEMWKY